MLAYVLYIFLSYALAKNRPVAVNEFKRMLLCAGIFFISANIIRTDRERLFVLSSWIIGSAVAVIYGVMQRYGRVWIFEVPSMDHVFSTFGNPIFFAAYVNRKKV